MSKYEEGNQEEKSSSKLLIKKKSPLLVSKSHPASSITKDVPEYAFIYDDLKTIIMDNIKCMDRNEKLMNNLILSQDESKTTIKAIKCHMDKSNAM